jgi:hypothetical protein
LAHESGTGNHTRLCGIDVPFPSPALRSSPHLFHFNRLVSGLGRPGHWVAGWRWPKHRPKNWMSYCDGGSWSVGSRRSWSQVRTDGREALPGIGATRRPPPRKFPTRVIQPR